MAMAMFFRISSFPLSRNARNRRVFDVGAAGQCRDSNCFPLTSTQDRCDQSHSGAAEAGSLAAFEKPRSSPSPVAHRRGGDIVFGVRSVLKISTVVIALLAPPTFSPLAQAKPGDLYIGNAGNGKVLRINHKSGAQHVVASGQGLNSPDSGAFDDKGRLVIADYGAAAVFRVNVDTGAVAPLASGPPLEGPTDVAIGAGGKIYTADPFAGGGLLGAIFKVASGAATLVSDGQHFDGGPLGLAILPNGKILTADQDGGPSDSGALLKVNPKNGHQDVITEGGKLVNPYGMTLKRSKVAYLADPGSDSIVRVKLKTGRQKVIAKGKPLNGPTDVALGLNGKLYAVNDSGEPKVIKVNPKTGAAHVFAKEGKLDAPEGITVEPRN
jgi:sugar lactone lactonase YvrE